MSSAPLEWCECGKIISGAKSTICHILLQGYCRCPGLKPRTVQSKMMGFPGALGCELWPQISPSLDEPGYYVLTSNSSKTRLHFLFSAIDGMKKKKKDLTGDFIEELVGFHEGRHCSCRAGFHPFRFALHYFDFGFLLLLRSCCPFPAGLERRMGDGGWGTGGSLTFKKERRSQVSRDSTGQITQAKNRRGGEHDVPTTGLSSSELTD